MRKWLHTYVEQLEPLLKRKPFLNITLFADTHKKQIKAPKEKNSRRKTNRSVFLFPEMLLLLSSGQKKEIGNNKEV